MLKTMQGLIVSIGLVALATGAEAAKYETIEVTDGGTLVGKVQVDASKAESEGFIISKDSEVCGTGDRTVEWVRTNGGALLDAVVYLEAIDAGKAFPADKKDAKINQEGCEFMPYLSVMENSGQLEAVNSDPVTHNIHTYELIGRARRSVINVSQSEQGNKISKKIKLRKGTAMKVECDVHNFMHAFVFVAKTPYYAVVNDNGEFTIDGVPPGKYTLKTWHGRLGEQDVEIEVAAGGTVETNFAY
ncbi:MAG: carboxypeptidase-like regulatory domain-containing protein [Alphaproteobacteria bacterium]